MQILRVLKLKLFPYFLSVLSILISNTLFSQPTQVYFDVTGITPANITTFTQIGSSDSLALEFTQSGFTFNEGSGPSLNTVFTAANYNPFTNGSAMITSRSPSISYGWSDVINNSVQTDWIPDRALSIGETSSNNTAPYVGETAVAGGATGYIASLQQVFGYNNGIDSGTTNAQNNMWRFMSNVSGSINWSQKLFFPSGQYITVGQNDVDVALIFYNSGFSSLGLTFDGLASDGTPLGSPFPLKLGQDLNAVQNNLIFSTAFSNIFFCSLAGVAYQLTNQYGSNTKIYGFLLTANRVDLEDSFVAVIAAPAPEPCSMVAFGIAGGLGLIRLRRKRKS